MADESPTIAALQMDRGLPLGNSDDAFSRRALHTKIGNKTTEAIPVFLTNPGPSAAQVKNIYDQIPPLADGTETPIVSYTVPVGKTFYVERTQYSGETIGTYRLKIDGVIQAVGITYWGPGFSGELNFYSEQGVGLTAIAGQLIELTIIHFRVGTLAPFYGRIQGVEV